MILVDTSVWVDHLRTVDVALADLLNTGQILIHPFVIGELACGNLNRRAKILSLLNDLPASPVATDDEVLHFIEVHQLMGQGIGYIDAHLLAATALANKVQLWTRDKRLQTVAESQGIAFSP